MDETQKRVIVIVVAVVAILAAGYSAFKFATADQLQPGVKHKSPPVSLKKLEMDRQKAEEEAAKSGATAPSAPDKDLSGAVGGHLGKD